MKTNVCFASFHWLLGFASVYLKKKKKGNLPPGGKKMNNIFPPERRRMGSFLTSSKWNNKKNHNNEVHASSHHHIMKKWPKMPFACPHQRFNLKYKRQTTIRDNFQWVIWRNRNSISRLSPLHKRGVLEKFSLWTTASYKKNTSNLLTVIDFIGEQNDFCFDNNNTKENKY